MRKAVYLFGFCAVGALIHCGGRAQSRGGAGAAGQGGTGDTGASGAGSAVAGSPADSGASGSSNLNESGAAGTAGDAGSAGAASQPCVQDSDCSEKLSDTENCVAVCSELHGTGTCVVQGKDEDHDGHRSSACLAAPGDDCNDSEPSVYKGAPELCDHLDNDCNGKVDLNDGLALSGTATSRAKAASSSYLAYASDTSVFAVLAGVDGDPDYTVDLRNPAGNIVVPAVGITGSLIQYDSGTMIAGGGDGFATAWTHAGTGMFRTIASDGTLGPLVAFGVTIKGLAHMPGGDWGVVFQTAGPYGVVELETVSAAGVANGAPVDLGIASYLSNSVAVTSAGFVLASYNPVLGATFVTIGTFDASKVSPFPDPFDVGNLVFGSGPNGFAMTRGRQIFLFGPDVNQLCGPVNIDFDPVQLTASSKGYLVMSSSTQVQEILADCSLGQSFSVHSGRVTNANIAGGAAGSAVGWDDADGSHIFQFGPDFCN